MVENNETQAHILLNISRGKLGTPLIDLWDDNSLNKQIQKAKEDLKKKTKSGQIKVHYDRDTKEPLFNDYSFREVPSRKLRAGNIKELRDYYINREGGKLVNAGILERIYKKPKKLSKKIWDKIPEVKKPKISRKSVWRIKDTKEAFVNVFIIIHEFGLTEEFIKTPYFADNAKYLEEAKKEILGGEEIIVKNSGWLKFDNLSGGITTKDWYDNCPDLLLFLLKKDKKLIKFVSYLKGKGFKKSEIQEILEKHFALKNYFDGNAKIDNVADYLKQEGGTGKSLKKKG